MNLDLEQERDRLRLILTAYESGGVTHYDENERGELARDVTPERIESVRERLAQIDRKLSEQKPEGDK